MQTYSFTPSAKCSSHPGLRRFSAFLACCAFWLSCAAGAEAETERHPDVAAALAWSLPESGCASPDSFTSLGDETAQIDVIRHQQTYTSAGMFGVAVAGGGDDAAIKREQRRQTRWHACMRAYKQRLVDDFGVLRASFERPMTRTDAEAIASKLRTIQDIVTSPTGEVSGPE